MKIATIILAAGRGTRMKSALPKVLHPVGGRPIARYVVDIAKNLRSLKTLMVIGHQAELVRQEFANDVSFVLQPELLGTADALRRCEASLKGFNGTVVVLCGDTPLLLTSSVRALVKKHHQAKAQASILSARLDNPHGYGRIIRNDKSEVIAIREHKDCSVDELAIKEINSGVYCFDAKEVFKALAHVKLNAKKKEFYLTDVIEYMMRASLKVQALVVDDQTIAFGVNDRQDLATASNVMRQRILNEHMRQGVTIVDPSTTYIEANVRIGQDTVIYPCTYIHTEVVIGANCRVGPFARLRQQTRLANNVEVGNFAEISRSQIGEGVFVKHVSFLGDAIIGAGANIGAGTITANFDGKQKHQTQIGKKAFIGSDAVLIAPVTVGDEAMVGAGAVVKAKTVIAKGKKAVGVPARIL